MSAYAFQLLMNFLQDSSAPANVLLLKIINQFLNIRVLVSKSTSSSTLASAIGITGTPSESVSSTNQGKVQWGVNPVDPAIEVALQQRGKVESRLNELLQGPLAHLKRVYTTTSLNAPVNDRIPKPPATAVETNAEIERLRNLAKGQFKFGHPPFYLLLYSA